MKTHIYQFTYALCIILGLHSLKAQIVPITYFGTNTTQGSNLDQFNQPQGILRTSDGKIYVADAGNNRISVWTQSGNTFGNVATFGSAGSGLADFNNPLDIAQSADGRLFITDQVNNRISVWSVSGNNYTHLTTFGGLGAGANQFDTPAGLVISSDGKIFVGDGNNSRVSVWTISGNSFLPLATFGGLGGNNNQFGFPADIAIGTGGSIFVADNTYNRICVWTTAGNTFGNLTVFGSNNVFGGITPTDFATPSSVALDANGKIFVVDKDNSRISIWTQTGNTFGFITSLGGVYGTALNQFANPSSVTILPDGKILIGDQLARVSVWQSCVTPVIVTQPSSQTVCGGTMVTFSVSTTGIVQNYLWSNGATTPSMQTSVAGTYTLTVSGACGSAISNVASLAIGTANLITQTLSPKTVCGGNPTTVAVTAVGANLSYLWNTGDATSAITITTSGTYAVTVTSGNCKQSDATSITIVPAFNRLITITSSNLQAIETGVSYQWLNASASFTGIAGANQQSFRTTLCGENFFAVELSKLGCKDTSYSLLQTRSTNGYIYPQVCETSYTSPSGKYNYTATGVYNDTIPNTFGCDSIITIDLTVFKRTSVNLGRDTTICFFGSKTIEGPKNATSYLWSTGATTPGISVNSSGLYTLTISSGVCGNTMGGINISVVGFKPQPTVLGTQMRVENIAGATYQWLDCSNGMQPVASATDTVLNLSSCPGTIYNFAVKVNEAGCIATSDCQQITVNYFPKGSPIGEFTDLFGNIYQPIKSHLNATGDQMIVDFFRSSGTNINISSLIYKWNGSQWSLSSFAPLVDNAGLLYYFLYPNSFRKLNFTDMNAQGNVVASVANYNQVKVYNYANSLLTQKGNTITIPGIATSDLGVLLSDVKLDAQGNTVLVAKYALKNTMQVYTYNNNTWSTKGAVFSFSGIATAMNSDGNIVAYIDYNGAVSLYSWIGTSWLPMGTAISISGAFSFNIDALGTTVAIASTQGTKIKVNIYKWNSSQWIADRQPYELDLNSSFDKGIINSGSIKLSADANTLLLSHSTKKLSGVFFTGGGSFGATGEDLSSYTQIIRWKDNNWQPKSLPMVSYSNQYSEFAGTNNELRFAEQSVAASADLSAIVLFSAINYVRSSGIKSTIVVPYNYSECDAAVLSIDSPEKENKDLAMLKVYPNPAASVLTISLAEGMASKGTLELFNSNGVLVASQQVLQKDITLPISQWQTGLYVVRYTTPSGKGYTAKVMKE